MEENIQVLYIKERNKTKRFSSAYLFILVLEVVFTVTKSYKNINGLIFINIC